MINVALPTGRLGDSVYQLFDKIGYSVLDKDFGRKLIIQSEDGKASFFLVKPSDVAIYVEHGIADIGVVGKDILLEDEYDIYELLDLGLGKCKVSVAAPNNFADDKSSKLRVATKYPNIAKEYYSSYNREIDIIKLSGSIELAPLLGLSDVIVDIVETGTTLRENDLSVTADIKDISARLVANKSSYNFKYKDINNMVELLNAQVNGKKVEDK